MLINLNLPPEQRMLSYTLFGLEIKGWLMYGVPILFGLISAALLSVGVSFILLRQNEEGFKCDAGAQTCLTT